MITMLLYVLFSWAAFDFPIHTLRLLHSLALASQLTLCTPFASVLSGISTNSPFRVSLPFPVLRNRCPETPVVRFTQVLSTKTVHLKRPNGTLMYLTMPRLLQLCLRFGRYLRPFGPDTTLIFPKINFYYNYPHVWYVNILWHIITHQVYYIIHIT